MFYYNPERMLPYDKIFDLACMWDRNEIVTPNTTIKLITPIGKFVESTDIYDMCMGKAIELAALVQNTDKKIHVLWSGGIDSTVALLCLREVLPANKLVVMHTPESLVEYPGFFEQHIQGTFETFEFSLGTTWKAIDFGCSKGIVVTGEIGDQIFGTVLFLGKNKEWLTKPWENFNADLASNEMYQRFVAACPQKITTTADFIWWVNYAMKYQLVQCRMMLDNTSSTLNQNLFHFFDGKAFNDYAVSTPMEIKMPEYDTTNYKKPLRDVIYKLSNDAVYAYTKPKVRSWTPKYGKLSLRKMAFAIDTNFKRLYRG
jgi:hypothetical protein